MHPKISVFLSERDRARSRGDWGVERSLSADLRRWGVADDATHAQPNGLPRKAAQKRAESSEDPQDLQEPSQEKRGGRPKLPRCEHGKIVERCIECNPEQAVV